MAIDAALFSGAKCYFFKGNRYIRVTRGETGPGTVDSGYPAPISNWGWPAGFGSTGIDAALYSGSKCYFFKGNRYIRVTRGDTGPGTVDSGYPAPISNWGWPAGFGSTGIDAALYSGSKCYFFKGNRYIRVTRGDTGPGTVDSGYPAPISNWGWPAGFGSTGIDAALYSGSKCYFFKGDRYIRVTRGETGPGTVDPGYPAPISNWGWNREFVVVHFKSLLPINATIRDYIAIQFTEMQRLLAPLRIDVRGGRPRISAVTTTSIRCSRSTSGRASSVSRPTSTMTSSPTATTPAARISWSTSSTRWWAARAISSAARPTPTISRGRRSSTTPARAG